LLNEINNTPICLTINQPELVPLMIVLVYFTPKVLTEISICKVLQLLISACSYFLLVHINVCIFGSFNMCHTSHTIHTHSSGGAFCDLTHYSYSIFHILQFFGIQRTASVFGLKQFELDIHLRPEKKAPDFRE